MVKSFLFISKDGCLISIFDPFIFKSPVFGISIFALIFFVGIAPGIIPDKLNSFSFLFISGPFIFIFGFSKFNFGSLTESSGPFKPPSIFIPLFLRS